MICQRTGGTAELSATVIGWLTEINPLALAIGWLHFTVTFLSTLFDAERRDSAV